MHKSEKLGSDTQVEFLGNSVGKVGILFMLVKTVTS